MFNGKSFHEVGPRKLRLCVVCSSSFSPRSGVNKFCSAACKGKWQYITGRSSTENQYKKISGNWDRYLPRLINTRDRKKDGLSKEILMQKLEKQDFKCALTGLELTCNLEKGIKNWTNASLDRIEAGGPYTPENVQIVCKGVNCWRADQTIEQFVEMCRKVVNKADRDKGVKDGQA